MLINYVFDILNYYELNYFKYIINIFGIFIRILLNIYLFILIKILNIIILNIIFLK